MDNLLDVAFFSVLVTAVTCQVNVGVGVGGCPGTVMCGRVREERGEGAEVDLRLLSGSLFTPRIFGSIAAFQNLRHETGAAKTKQTSGPHVTVRGEGEESRRGSPDLPGDHVTCSRGSYSDRKPPVLDNKSIC